MRNKNNVVTKKIITPPNIAEEIAVENMLKEEAKRRRSEAAKLSWKKRKEAKEAEDKKAAKAKKDAAAQRARNKATKNVLKKIPAAKNTLSAIQQRQKMLDEAAWE